MPHYTDDNSYKQFFSDPKMVKALLTGFVDPELIRHFDLTTLEKMNGVAKQHCRDIV